MSWGFYLVFLTIIALDSVGQRINVRALPMLSISIPLIYSRSGKMTTRWIDLRLKFWQQEHLERILKHGFVFIIFIMIFLLVVSDIWFPFIEVIKTFFLKQILIVCRNE